jgi:arylesterase/paraoxonase
LLAVLLVLLGGFVLRTLQRTGMFRTVEPHFAGTCRLVPGPIGPEDLTIHPQTGVAFVSAYDRFGASNGRPSPGAILAYDLNEQNPSPVNLTPDAGTTFQPHGMSLWVGDDGREALFVVNHPAVGSGRPSHAVEVFDIHDGVLVRRETLEDERLTMPNDLVAVGPDEFYVTNTYYFPPGKMQTLEAYLQVPWGYVMHYRNGAFSMAVEGVLSPNGINLSLDGRLVYVMGSMTGVLHVYDRSPSDGVLTLREEFFIDAGGDNIEIDTAGNLWIAAHPKLFDLVAHLADPKQRSPSQVIRLSPKPGGGYDMTEVYMNAGDELSGVSVAAVRGSRLLIGQIMNEGFLDCLMDR